MIYCPKSKIMTKNGYDLPKIMIYVKVMCFLKYLA